MLIMPASPHNNVHATSSPSISRQLISDDPNDWDKLPITNNTNCTKIKSVPDIEAITYQSDGRVLNATFWMSGPTDEKPSLLSSPRFLMGISFISNYKNATLDYTVSVDWDGQIGYWTKTLEEHIPYSDKVIYDAPLYKVRLSNSPITNVKILDRENASERLVGQMNLSVNLSDIGYPDRYFLRFVKVNTIIEKNIGFCVLADYLDTAAFIPQPQFSISLPEEHVMLRPGDSKTVGLRINSTIPIESNISFPNPPIEGLRVEFLPQNQSLTPNGLTIEQLRLQVLKNTIQDNGTQVLYPIPIKPIIHFSKINLPSVNESGNVYANQTLTPNPSYMTMTVLPPPTFPEQLNIFVKDWISPISGIWFFLAGVAVIVGPLAIRWYNKKHKL
jgi:hypothetical protein